MVFPESNFATMFSQSQATPGDGQCTLHCCFKCTGGNTFRFIPLLYYLLITTGCRCTAHNAMHVCDQRCNFRVLEQSEGEEILYRSLTAPAHNSTLKTLLLLHWVRMSACSSNSLQPSIRVLTSLIILHPCPPNRH